MSEQPLEFKLQDSQYLFPYHYLTGLDKANFYIGKSRSIGYEYMSYVSHIVRKLGVFDDVLDVGTGDGRIICEIKKHHPNMYMRGIDISERAIAFAKAFVSSSECVLGDIRDPDVFSGHVFSAALCVEVLEHIPPSELTDFVAGIAMHVKPGGKLFITVPSDNIPVSRKHYQHFNPEKLNEFIKDHFVLIELYYLNRMHWFVSFMKSILVNKYFILNNRRLLNFLYRGYCTYYFRGAANDTRRIYAEYERISDA